MPIGTASLRSPSSTRTFVVVERGAQPSAAQTDEIIRRASLAPIEGNRKVLVLDEFHLIRPSPAELLKVIEEPPAGRSSWCWSSTSRPSW
jgi:hypothetical protein